MPLWNKDAIALVSQAAVKVGAILGHPGQVNEILAQFGDLGLQGIRIVFGRVARAHSITLFPNPRRRWPPFPGQ